MTISSALLLNTVFLVLSKHPALRLQSIQDTNGAWLAEDRREVGVQAPSEVEGTWRSQQESLTPPKEKGTTILQALQIWHRGERYNYSQPQNW